MTIEYTSTSRVRVDEIDFAGTDGYLVSPLSPTAVVGTATEPAIGTVSEDAQGSGRSLVPGVILAGQAGVRERFLAEAVQFALRGAVTITLRTELHFSGTPDDDLAMVRAAVSVQRQAITLLREHELVDADRIGMIAHGWGATQASVLLQDDAPLRAVVLAGTSTDLSGFFWSFGPRSVPEAEYVKVLSAVDWTPFVSESLKIPVLYQVGERDQNVPLERADELWAGIQAGRARQLGATRFDYDCDHNLVDHREARQDRLAWLTNALSL